MKPTGQTDGSVIETPRADPTQDRGDYDHAMAEAERLEAEPQSAKAMIARLESLIAAEAQARLRADELARKLAIARRTLTWRTIALEILLLGVAAISAVIWITHWWPWQ